MTTETQLWHWLLFSGCLPPLRAKALIDQWTQQGMTLEAALKALPQQADRLGLSTEEAIRLASVPDQRDTFPAVRWNEPLYPAGLRNLPLRLRPALLCYEGDAGLLTRSIVFLAPGSVPIELEERLEGLISLLLGEDLLIGAYEDSPQAHAIFRELADSEGEALILAREGLNSCQTIPQHRALIDQSRLLVLTPLRPTATSSLSIDASLRKVALAAASSVIATELASLPADPEVSLPPLALLAPRLPVPSLPSGIAAYEDPGDVLEWLTQPTRAQHEITSTPRPAPEDAGLSSDADLGPPPNPQEILSRLEQGGSVPEVLRRRLLKRP